MFDPDLLDHLSKVRQKELIERGQQSGSAHFNRLEPTGEFIMLDPHELQELGRERQQALIAWRENRRVSKRQIVQAPPGESAVIRVPRWVAAAIFGKIRLLGMVRAAVLTSTAGKRPEVKS